MIAGSRLLSVMVEHLGAYENDQAKLTVAY